jgi:diaminopimelate dehydrogenase
MPKYFADYDTTVIFETPKEVAERKKQMPHGGFVMTSGETGKGNKAFIEYKVDWASNPEATGSILVACARAGYKLWQDGKAGAFTLLDIPPAYLSPRPREELLRDFM